MTTTFHRFLATLSLSVAIVGCSGKKETGSDATPGSGPNTASTPAMVAPPIETVGFADRKAAQRFLELGGIVNVIVGGQFIEVKPGSALPSEAFKLDHVYLAHNGAVNDVDIELLKGLPFFGSLSLRGTHITDAGINHLKGNERLRALDLSSTKITENGLTAILETLSGLRNLHIADTPMTDRIMSQIEKKQLTYFEAARTAIGDAGVAYLKGKQFSRCDLEGTQLTDIGLMNLEGSGFDYLGLSNTRITDAGIEHCKKFTKLGAINLKNTQVTDAGVGSLLKAFPDCKIER